MSQTKNIQNLGLVHVDILSYRVNACKMCIATTRLCIRLPLMNSKKYKTFKTHSICHMKRVRQKLNNIGPTREINITSHANL